MSGMGLAGNGGVGLLVKAKGVGSLVRVLCFLAPPAASRG
jgi:hypothetical protein